MPLEREQVGMAEAMDITPLPAAEVGPGAVRARPAWRRRCSPATPGGPPEWSARTRPSRHFPLTARATSLLLAVPSGRHSASASGDLGELPAPAPRTRHCHTAAPPSPPSRTASSPSVYAAARVGFRRAHLADSLDHPGRTHAHRLAGREPARSAASAPAVGYRSAGSFARHFRQISSTSRGSPGTRLPGRSGSSSATFRRSAIVVRVLERPGAGQALVEDHPEGIDVGLRADELGLAPGLLGGHVRRRAHHGLGGRQVAPTGSLGQAEVGDLGLAAVVVQDVGGLQVAVDDPQVVGRLDRAGERRHQLRRGLRVEPAGPLEPVGQAAAGEVLHGQERPAVGVAVFVDLDDVGVLDGGDRLGLGQEADQLLRPSPMVAQHHLQGDQPVQLHLPGLPDHSHPALPERLEQVVPGDGLRSPRRATGRPAGVSLPRSRSGRPAGWSIVLGSRSPRVAACSRIGSADGPHGTGRVGVAGTGGVGRRARGPGRGWVVPVRGVGGVGRVVGAHIEALGFVGHKVARS